ncbi:MAG: hypothetical protein ACI9BD_000059 [Candidatus Marinamargulisbacteria bacterium]|jgi:hypothetical protein
MVRCIYLFFVLMLGVSPICGADLEFSLLQDEEWNPGKGYNPFSTRETVYGISMTVLNSSAQKLDFFITVSRGNNNDPSYDRRATAGSEYLTYQGYSNKSAGASQILKEVPDLDTEDNTVIGARLKGGKTKTVLYYVQVPINQYVNSDDYTDNLTFRLYKGAWTATPAGADLMETKSIQLTIPVQKFLYLDAGVGNFGNTMTLEMGEVIAKARQDFDLRVVSNTIYDVTAQSANSGKLAHVNPVLTSTTDYEFYVNGALINLSSGLAENMVVNEPLTTADGVTYTVRVAFPNTVPLMSQGNYNDQIVLTLTSQ